MVGRKCLVCGLRLRADGHRANLCDDCYDQAVREITHTNPDTASEAAAMKNLVGRRIRLLHTDDVYTKLHYGSLGSINDVTSTPWGDVQVWVDWDDGSRLALIASKDSFEFV